jgi:hypothetical protein
VSLDPERSLTYSEKDAAFAAYCASFAGVVKPDSAFGSWHQHVAAALLIGAEDRAQGHRGRTRAGLLAEVERRLAGEAEPADRASAVEVLDRVEAWANDEEDERLVDALLADLRRELGGAS